MLFDMDSFSCHSFTNSVLNIVFLVMLCSVHATSVAGLSILEGDLFSVALPEVSSIFSVLKGFSGSFPLLF